MSTSLYSWIAPPLALNLKPAPQVEASEEANRPQSQKNSGVLVCGPRSALGVVVVQEQSQIVMLPWDSRSQDPSGPWSQGMKGHPLAYGCRNWGITRV